MKRIFIGAFCWITAMAFIASAQAGPFDITDDSYVTHSRACN